MATTQEASAEAEPVQVAAPAIPKQDRMIPVILKRGYWPMPGAIYYDEDGEEKVVPNDHVIEVRTPDGSRVIDRYVDEAVRKAGKLKAGTRMLLAARHAKPLIDAGKATLDVGM